jgi:hypothetical protein
VPRPVPVARRLVLDAWPLVPAVVLTLPLLRHGGYPLARDLVFVPHQPWTDASLGLGDTAPRAVPLDAVVSVFTAQVLDGAVLARVAIPLILAVAGWGAHRLVRDLGFAARLAAGGFAVWNPYVVERLALGQWALLSAYAALPWLVLAARRYRDVGGWAAAGSVAGWLGLASLTPTGGLIGTLTVLTCGLGRDRRRDAVLVATSLVLQLTWLLPSVLRSGGLTSDPAGIAAFAADGEGPGGVWTALVGLGGIWDSQSVPSSREGWWGVATAVAAVVVLVLGWRLLRRIWGSADLTRLALLSGIGLLLALLPTVPPGADLLRWVVGEVPGGGLLRDSQKFLAPYVVLVVASFAASVHRLVRFSARAGAEMAAAVAIVAVVVPVFLLPDATRTVWPTVEPTRYPSAFREVADVVDGEGPVVTLPWRSYRLFDWGSGLVSSDPAVRWFDTEVVVDDDLALGTGVVVRGESARAQRVAAALDSSRPADALADVGIRWVLVYLDDPAVGDLDLSGLDLVVADDDLALYAVPGVARTGLGEPSAAERVAVTAAMVLAAMLVLLGTGVATWSRLPSSRRRGATLAPEERETA